MNSWTTQAKVGIVVIVGLVLLAVSTCYGN